MSLNAQNAASQNPVYEESRSIATTGRSDAPSGNLESSEEAGSVLSNASVQTSVGGAVPEGRPTKPGNGQLTDAEIEERADQVIENEPGILGCNLADMWRHLHPSVLKCLYERQRQAEEALEKENIADEASLAQDASDALSEDKKKAS
jgi:hypothetical protein